jgi:hypothetical protein
VLGAVVMASLLAAAAPPRSDPPRLPARIHRIVLHVLGGPAYGRPELRWVFHPPQRTLSLWRPRFGAHWILWTDGSIWPREAPAQAPSYLPPAGQEAADDEWGRRVAREAAPVFSHVYLGNSRSVGIELAHSGRGDAPFPEAQLRSLMWLLRTLIGLSQGGLAPSSIVGHKDLDQRPAYVRAACERPGCEVFVDPDGRAYRRRVDPPESLFAALAAAGLAVPRPSGADADLERAQALPPQGLPRLSAP